MQEHLLNQKIPRPRVTNSFRRMWVILSKVYPGWKNALMIFQPETIMKWHKRAFKIYWWRKSKVGRPKISPATIVLIKRIYKENPLLSPEKIHERLVHLGIIDAPAPNTIAKYIRSKRTAPTEKQVQSWQTFLRNHAKNTWAMDFAVVPTWKFQPLYVLLVISHTRRKIEHFAVTEHPTAQWLIQQIRNATAFGLQPKYLIHDNGPPFKASDFQQFLSNIGIKSKAITPYKP